MTRTTVVGTAGHIDHGKSTLVHALTGIDPDRLKEEKARGITIDLGFAHASIGDLEVAFVDVPGHERFVRNMLAGAGGIDAVLVVIAADESVMPQTREHVDICRLLGIDRAVVALTKSDLVDADALELARLEAAELLARGSFGDVEIIPVSARTGAGLDALRAALARLAPTARPRDRAGVVRLPVDRVFSVRGFGTVVTGTLVSGRVEVGDALIAQPSGAPVRVRGLQVHGRAVDAVAAPSRVAMNVGTTDRADLVRGTTIASADAAAVTRRVDLAIELVDDVRPLRHGMRVRLHHGTSACVGRVWLAAWRAKAEAEWRAVPAGAARVDVPAGGAALMRLRLDEPTVLTRGDRVVLRSCAPVATIGGGVVIDPEAPPGRVRRAAAFQRFVALAAEPLTESLWLDPADARGVSAAVLVRRWGVAPDEARRICEAAVRSGAAVGIGDSVVATAVVERIAAGIASALARFHAAQPLEPGLSRSALREDTASDAPVALFDRVVADLAGSGRVTGADRLALASHRQQTAAASDEIRDRLLAEAERVALLGLDAAGLASAVGVSVAEVEPRLRALVRDGKLERLDVFFVVRSALDRLREDVRGWKADGASGDLDVGAFKERFGLTRKHAIPLLEWLDRVRVTRRVGNSRRIL